jgi:FMN reductase
MSRPLILGLGGTMRAESTSEKALRVSLAAARERGAETVMLSGADLDVPMYGLGLDGRAARLVELMRRCDGIIVSSPAFHGGMSGLIKNALDYAEELRSDPRVYLDGIAFGPIVCAAGWQAVGSTLATLRGAHALRAWPTPMGVGINSLAAPFGADGRALDEAVQRQLELVADQVVEFSCMRRASAPASVPRDLPRLAAGR